MCFFLTLPRACGEGRREGLMLLSWLGVIGEGSSDKSGSEESSAANDVM